MNQFTNLGKALSLLLLGALFGNTSVSDVSDPDEKHSLSRVESLLATPCAAEYSAYASAVADLEDAEAEYDAAAEAADIAWLALEECLEDPAMPAQPEIETFSILEE